MASLEPRANGTVRVVWRRPGEARRQSLTAPTAAAADELRRLIEDAGHQVTRDDVIRLIDGTTATGTSVKDWVVTYVDSLASIESRTRADYRRQADTYMAELTMPVAALERPHVRAWVNRLAKTRSPKTVANVHGLLSAAMTEAVAQRLRPDNPCAGTRLPRRDDHTDDGEQVFLTKDEFDAIAAQMPDWLRPVIEVTVRTGLRWAEVTALRVRQLRLDTTPPSLSVSAAWKRQADHSKRLGPPKSRKSRRVVEVDARTAQLLADAAAGKAPDALVFTSVRDQDKPLPSTTFWRHWDRAIDATIVCDDCRADTAIELEPHEPCGHASTKVPRFHDLRHTHVAWLIDAGIDITVISRRLGHESIKTTFDTYGHLLPTAGEKVVAALDRL